MQSRSGLFGWMLICAMALLAGSPTSRCGTNEDNQARPRKLVEDSLAKDALRAIRLGVQYLEKTQQPDGSWSSPDFPAVTALVVSAILHSPDLAAGHERPDAVKRGLARITACAAPDGGIYVQTPKEGGLPNYNTALCLMALADANDPTYNELIRRARAYLISSQYLGEGDFHGGMGYDAHSGRAYADLSNTMMALEALRRTEPAEQSGEKELDWRAAIEFVSRCQNLRETNKARWVSDAPEERGGFVYYPGKSMAGEAKTTGTAAQALHSYGTMTYAGLLSFIYADLNRSDPRVKAADEWILRRWTLDENPGMGVQGLYYNYHTMAKALDLMGQEDLALADGRTIGWRAALAAKLVELQKLRPEDGAGFWRNENNRWWEGDPNLVTAYTLLALERAAFGLR